MVLSNPASHTIGYLPRIRILGNWQTPNPQRAHCPTTLRLCQLPQDKRIGLRLYIEQDVGNSLNIQRRRHRVPSEDGLYQETEISRGRGVDSHRTPCLQKAMQLQFALIQPRRSVGDESIASTVLLCILETEMPPGFLLSTRCNLRLSTSRILAFRQGHMG